MTEGNELFHLQKLLAIEGNNVCFDCGASGPTWASLSHGSFICLACSGIHRGFGLQISFVKSITMDTWSSRQLIYMENGGNAKLKAFFDEYKISALPISARYKTEGAAYYRKYLRAVVDSTQLPPPLDHAIALQPESQVSDHYGNLGADFSSADPNKPFASKKSSATPPLLQGDVFNSIGSAFGSFAQAAFASAEKAVTDIQSSAIVDQAKGAFEMSKTWLESKGKKIATNVQNPEWWEENHCKAKIGAQKVADQITNVASNAHDWLLSRINGTSVAHNGPTHVNKTKVPTQTTTHPPVCVTGGAALWSEPKDSDETDPIMDHFKKSPRPTT